MSGRRPTAAVRAAVVVLLICVVAAVAGVVVIGAGPADGDDPDEVTYAVLPHPDDEFQVWSQIEGRPGSYTVLISLTRGETSGFCDSRTGGGTDASGVRARLWSWTHFVSEMGRHDPDLPGELPDLPRTVRIGAQHDRDDPGEEVFVWHDRRDRGALLAFDLGDGRVTPEAVTRAIEPVSAEAATLGLVDREPDRLVGAYHYAGEDPSCFTYDHPDHAAVVTALTRTRFAEEQWYATCGADPGPGAEAVEVTVGPRSRQAAFGDGGLFRRHYGWLGNWAMSEDDQTGLFHAPQVFRAVP